MKIRIHGYVAESYVDGPGIRFALFTQGCRHHCPGCHNPQTHDFAKGFEIDNDEIVQLMLKDPLLDGLTLTGGDPLEQIDACLDLVKKVKQYNYSIIIYTGYIYEDIIEKSKNNQNLNELLHYIDYIIDGPFILSLKDLELNYCGSKNQRIIDVQQSLKEEDIVISSL